MSAQRMDHESIEDMMFTGIPAAAFTAADVGGLLTKYDIEPF